MRFPQLGLAVVLGTLVTGCGGGGDLAEGIPQGAFDRPPPPLSEAQLKMKDEVAKLKGGIAPKATPAAPGGGQSYIEKMKSQYNKGK